MGIEKQEIEEAPPADAPAAKTALGRRLLEIRQRIIASGEPLLGPAELEREVAERRGGYESTAP